MLINLSLTYKGSAFAVQETSSRISTEEQKQLPLNYIPIKAFLLSVGWLTGWFHPVVLRQSHWGNPDKTPNSHGVPAKITDVHYNIGLQRVTGLYYRAQLQSSCCWLKAKLLSHISQAQTLI